MRSQGYGECAERCALPSARSMSQYYEWHSRFLFGKPWTDTSFRWLLSWLRCSCIFPQYLRTNTSAYRLLSCWFIFQLILRPWRLRRNILPKRRVHCRRTTWLYTPEDRNLRDHRCEDLKSYIEYLFLLSKLQMSISVRYIDIDIAVSIYCLWAPVSSLPLRGLRKDELLIWYWTLQSLMCCT